jgi:hypothetical protein
MAVAPSLGDQLEDILMHLAGTVSFILDGLATRETVAVAVPASSPPTPVR